MYCTPESVRDLSTVCRGNVSGHHRLPWNTGHQRRRLVIRRGNVYVIDLEAIDARGRLVEPESGVAMVTLGANVLKVLDGGWVPL